MNKKQEKELLLSALYAPYQKCTLCPLGSLGRKKIVFGSGNPDATILLIGEGPGKEEDEQGLPFVGRSGKLLTKILLSIGIQRQDVYISNIVKCRPPSNRAPLQNEISICKKLLLEKQIEIIKPQVICTLGSVALNALLEQKTPLSTMRGLFTIYQNIPVLPTYHPAYILRNSKKAPLLIEDLQKAFQKIAAESPKDKNKL
ncbi:uracil-DNA glycosylase [Candidatus Babeliales bacterium]|nr:uracil-DNA glycosylase [Candidatus Babeliales bacterium]